MVCQPYCIGFYTLYQIFFTCLGAHHINAIASGGQKRATDPQEPDLEAVMSHYIGVENQTQVLCKRSRSS